MLLGLISLMLAQCARWISEICVNSSLFTSRFYICSEEDYATNEHILLENSLSSHNEKRGLSALPHQCGEVTQHLLLSFVLMFWQTNTEKKGLQNSSCWFQGREPFVSYEGLEQLHRFLFVLGITHVLYSCLAVGLAMSKVQTLLILNFIWHA